MARPSDLDKIRRDLNSAINSILTRTLEFKTMRDISREMGLIRFEVNKAAEEVVEFMIQRERGYRRMINVFVQHSGSKDPSAMEIVCHMNKEAISRCSDEVTVEDDKSGRHLIIRCPYHDLKK